MTAALALETETRREEWLEDRRSCITGTQISAILGLNKWMRPIDVWAEKTGINIPFEVTDAIRAGRRFETAILAETSERAGRELIYADPFELIRVPSFPLLGATLDARWADTGCPVDAKNIRYKDSDEWGDDGTDIMPDGYKLQLHVQAMALEADTADLAVCFSGQDFNLFHMMRDNDVDDLLKEEVTNWWTKHVIGGVQPDADGSENFTRYLKTRFDRNKLDLIPATDDLRALIFRVKTIKSDISELETRLEHAEQVVKLAIGEHEGIAGLCTWRNNKPGAKTDWKAVTADFSTSPVFAATVAKHTTPTPGARVLRLGK